MSTAKISRRYACALFDLINEGAKIGSDLAKVATVAANDEVCAIIGSPDYPVELKCNILTKAAGGSVAAEVERLISMLADRNKLVLLPEINAQVEALVHEQESKLEADVTVAAPLNADMQKNLSKALAAKSGKDVTLSIHEDQSILGGMVVRIGDLKLDYSLRTKLAGLRRALAS